MRLASNSSAAIVFTVKLTPFTVIEPFLTIYLDNEGGTLITSK